MLIIRSTVNFLRAFRRLWISGGASKVIKKLFAHILFVPGLSTKMRLEYIQDTLSSAAFQQNKSHLGDFFEQWDTSKLASTIADQVDDPLGEQGFSDAEEEPEDYDPYHYVRMARRRAKVTEKLEEDQKAKKAARATTEQAPPTKRAPTPTEQPIMEPGTLASDMLEDTDLMPPPLQVEAPLPPQPTDLGLEDPSLDISADHGKDHFFKGQRQPPVGVRLRHVLNFLADEDEHRCGT